MGVPGGNDISLQSRSLTTSGIGLGTLDNITAGMFAADSRAIFFNPAFLALSAVSFEMLLHPTTLTPPGTTGIILRVGAPTSTVAQPLVLRILSTGGIFVWSMFRRGNFGTNPTGSVTQTTDGTQDIVWGQTYHAVFAFANGGPPDQNSQIFINGAAIPVTRTNTMTGGGTLPAGPLTGTIPILATDELTIGDPAGTTQNPFLGRLGRVVVYPYAVTAAQAAASYRLQLDQGLAVGLGAETAAGATNRGPVAVPHTTAQTIADPDAIKFIDIDVATRSFDAEGNLLTAVVPSQSTTGVSSIIAATNRLRYRPNTGSGGPPNHTVPFGVRDPSGAVLQSNSIVRVSVTSTGGNGGNGGSEVFDWGYPFPNAAAVNSARVKILTFAELRSTTPPPDYQVGDIIVISGPSGPTTTVENGNRFDLLGPIVIPGIEYRPIPNRYGSASTSNPYRGTNNIIQLHFASNARSHASWQHETGQSVNWPFIFWCNSRINWQTNGCQFGDLMRGGIRGAQPRNNASPVPQLVGPQCAVFWNKIYQERGTHYANGEWDANGNLVSSSPTSAIFHSDGWQQSNVSGVGGTVCWRFANVYMNWIMGQAFFCGNQPEKYGFPRYVRQKYRDVAWEHAFPWDNNPAMPNPATTNPDAEGTLWVSPRMVMNFEGGFDAPNPIDLSQSSENPNAYAEGRYWAALFEGQCYIKRSTNHPHTNVNRYLNATNGINGRDANGNWQFSTGPTAIQSNHTYPAWEGNIRLLTPTQTLPQVVDPTHTGPAHRITSTGAAGVDQFMTMIGR